METTCDTTSSDTSDAIKGSILGRPKGVFLPGLAGAMSESRRKRSDVARSVGVSRAYLWKLEQLQHGTTPQTVEAIARELGKAPSELT